MADAWVIGAIVTTGVFLLAATGIEKYGSIKRLIIGRNAPAPAPANSNDDDEDEEEDVTKQGLTFDNAKGRSRSRKGKKSKKVKETRKSKRNKKK